jgi:hypothetical protein
MNRANPLPPNSKADNSKIERERSVNVSSGSVKNKVAVNRVAASKAAVSKADAKATSFEPQAAGGNSRRFFVFDTFRPITLWNRQSWESTTNPLIEARWHCLS